ncbi:MAG: hypothetical protein KC543_11930 [Myxococcales bacterium]|nr:hypothetical protein [Myxococcales bacterium]
MFSRKAALRPVPPYAVVDEHVVEALDEWLDASEPRLQRALDVAFRELELRQPAVHDWIGERLSAVEDPYMQSLGYFLAVVVFLAFRDAFPRRLTQLDATDLDMADETLSVDEALRAADPAEIVESDQVVALGQPAVLGYVQQHIGEALEQAEQEVDLDALDRVYRAVLVEVIALGHAVTSPSGHQGPPREALA